MKPQLKNIALICIDCYHYGSAVVAIKKSMEQADFGAVKFLTDIDIKVDGVDVVQIPSITSKEQYSEFCIKSLYDYIGDCQYVMLIQHDGYVINGDSWDDQFLEYDYIGAPWLYTDGKNVGNGGASLRSKKLQYHLKHDDFIFASDPEDSAIGRLYRDYLVKQYGIKFPPEELADKFSYELRVPTQPTFAFHGNFHAPYKPYVLVKRWAAMGDVVRVEPVLDYYHKNGYNVILDTHPSFFKLFQQHRFPVLHPQQIDGRIKPKVINLDMAYESKPQQNHLQTYYEYAGISSFDKKRPELNLRFDAKSPQYKLFQKYAIIHIDHREQPHRNVSGINWGFVSMQLILNGYTVVQIGKNDHEIVPNAVQFNCNTEELLLMLCAGADLFIGIDSGPSHICVAFNVPSIIFFGSVNPDIIHADTSNIIPIHNHTEKICDKPFCWHEKSGTTGQDCYVDAANPPCAKFSTDAVISAINQFQNKQISNV